MYQIDEHSGPLGQMAFTFGAGRDPGEKLGARFDERGGDAVADQEVLELFLARSTPTLAIADLAEALLRRFGDLARVLAAPRPQLGAVPGITSAAVRDLKVAELIAHRAARAEVMDRTRIGGWEALIGYCRTVMAHRQTEEVRVLYLDSANNLIADEVQGEGTVDHAPVYPREIVRRALELNAKALILVHNHPSGDPKPSRCDIEMTAKVRDACAALDLILHDHVIVGHGRETSFRASGLL